MIDKIVEKIRIELKERVPILTKEQLSRRDKILNSDNPDVKGYGNKMADIEKIAKSVFNEINCTYQEATEVYRKLFSSNVHEEKFAGFFFLNQFKKVFNKETINLHYEALSKYCDTWAFCDSSIIRVFGPFLAKRDELAKEIIEKWSKDKNLWVRRASMVVLLKIIIIKKEFDEEYVYQLVEKMLKYTEDYIQKGIGWHLKTCSRYNPKAIFNYLMIHKKELPRLILRYASEKLPKEKRQEILRN